MWLIIFSTNSKQSKNKTKKKYTKDNDLLKWYDNFNFFNLSGDCIGILIDKKPEKYNKR